MLVLRVGGGAYDTTEQLEVVGTHLYVCVRGGSVRGEGGGCECDSMHVQCHV